MKSHAAVPIKNFECTLCGSSDFTILLRINKPDRFERAVGIPDNDYIRHWVQCLSCGVASNVHSPENLPRLKTLSTAYYDIDFRSELILERFQRIMNLPPDKSDNAQRVLRITAFVKRWFISAHQKLPAYLKIIDVGAGLGVFLSCFLNESRREGIAWQSTAVEPDSHAAQHLRALNQFEVCEVEFVGQPEFADYDLCTLNKVVEHIEYPVPFMQDISKVLSKERGLVYVEVPDAMTIHYREPQDNILGALHYHLYSFRSLSYLLKTSNLVPIRMERVVEPSGKITIVAFATIQSVFDHFAFEGGSWQRS